MLTQDILFFDCMLVESKTNVCWSKQDMDALNINDLNMKTDKPQLFLLKLYTHTHKKRGHLQSRMPPQYYMYNGLCKSSRSCVYHIFILHRLCNTE